MTAPLIVTAEFASADFAFLDAERRAHFPPERNILAAHLTLFHALPPSVESEVRRRLADAADRTAPRATLAGLYSLGSGVAYAVHSDELEEVRGDIADAFTGCLTAQDAHGWRPHVTIQNKVTSSVARDLLIAKQRHFIPRPLGLAGLALHRYLGGPWETVQRWRFRGSYVRSPTPSQLISNAAIPLSSTDASIGMSIISPTAPAPSSVASSIASDQSDAS